MLEVGKKYLLIKPEDVNESPVWVSRMDKFNKKIVTITKTPSYISRWVRIKDDDNRNIYNEKWFHSTETKVNLFIKGLC